MAIGLIWSALGGGLAIAPATSLGSFPANRHAGINGVVTTAFGVGARVDTLVTGQLRDWYSMYGAAFYPLAGLAKASIVPSAKLLPAGRGDAS